MKKIGMLGGMSWESTHTYYKLINEEVKNKLGGLHSAKIILSSVDFDEIEKLQHLGDWDKLAEILKDEAQAIEAAKADFLLICTNTMHKVAPFIEKNINIPILHIADATAYKLQKNGVKKIALLGTRFTMGQDFYKQRIIEKFGIDVIIPNEEEQTLVHNIIYDELCLGLVKDSSREVYKKIIKRLEIEEGVEGVILGCTEISMLIQDNDVDIPTYDTTELHATAAVTKALS